MKYKIFLLSCLIIYALSLKAQQERISKILYANAYKTATNCNEKLDIRKIASFKVDAITYLNSRTLTQIIDTTKLFSNKYILNLNTQLDSMAYYMNEYVNLFTKVYTHAENSKKKKQLLRTFRNASINHSLYNDSDKTLVLVYFNSEDDLTPFSLDTNWIEAFEEVKKKITEDH